MGEAMVGLFFLLLIAGLVVHICSLGTFYIRFSGARYEVWQRKFGGYDDLHGFFPSEQSAREKIERLKRNPPRTIRS